MKAAQVAIAYRNDKSKLRAAVGSSMDVENVFTTSAIVTPPHFDHG